MLKNKNTLIIILGVIILLLGFLLLKTSKSEQVAFTKVKYKYIVKERVDTLYIPKEVFRDSAVYIKPDTVFRVQSVKEFVFVDKEKASPSCEAPTYSRLYTNRYEDPKYLITVQDSIEGFLRGQKIDIELKEHYKTIVRTDTVVEKTITKLPRYTIGAYLTTTLVNKELRLTPGLDVATYKGWRLGVHSNLTDTHGFTVGKRLFNIK